MTYLKTGGVAVSLAAMSVMFADYGWAQDATIQIGGRLMVDHTIANIGDDDINTSETRRARLFAKGNYGSNIKYKFEFNHTSNSGIELTDGLIEFHPDSKNYYVKLGHFKTTNSFEEEASSRFITTIERGAFTDAFELNRRVGVAIGTRGDNYGLDAGIYGSSIDLEDGTEDGYAFSARGFYNPVKTDETVAHIGASWRYRKQGDDQSDLRYRQRPYTHQSNRIIQSDRFADSDNFYAAELAVLHNNLWAAGEYAIVNANASDAYVAANGDIDASFSGGYAEAGIMIGGRRTYKGGKLNRPKVDTPFGEGGTGAFAFVARYDTIDLEDAPNGGQQDTIVLGAEWWPTKQVRIVANYFDVDADNARNQDGSITGIPSLSGDGVVARLSIDF